MVLGTPTKGTPPWNNCWPMLNDAVAADADQAANVQLLHSRLHTVDQLLGRRRVSPWPTFAENRPRLAVPRMVPPRVKSQAQLLIIQLPYTAGVRGCPHSRRENQSCPPRLAAALATARITAFSPGQSPPPVTMPMRSLIIFLVVGLVFQSSPHDSRVEDRCEVPAEERRGEDRCPPPRPSGTRISAPWPGPWQHGKNDMRMGRGRLRAASTILGSEFWKAGMPNRAAGWWWSYRTIVRLIRLGQGLSLR